VTRRILVVDDDPRLREVVRYALSREGFEVLEAGDGHEALRSFEKCTAEGAAPDLVVLDVVMPEMDGIEVCRRLRQQGRTPILFLSSRGDEVDRVLGLELGGDDYVTKPFSPRELVSRVKAVLRRTMQDPAPPDAEAADSSLEVGDIRLDPDEVRVLVGDLELKLTATEFRLLQVLMTRPGRVYSRDELMERGYEGTHFVSGRTLDSHIRRIRQKFKEAGKDPIETVHGMGFRIRRTT
jgi:two-component system, OmpR family, response regulator